MPLVERLLAGAFCCGLCPLDRFPGLGIKTKSATAAATTIAKTINPTVVRRERPRFGRVRSSRRRGIAEIVAVKVNNVYPVAMFDFAIPHFVQKWFPRAILGQIVGNASG